MSLSIHLPQNKSKCKGLVHVKGIGESVFDALWQLFCFQSLFWGDLAGGCMICFLGWMQFGEIDARPPGSLSAVSSKNLIGKRGRPTVGTQTEEYFNASRKCSEDR